MPLADQFLEAAAAAKNSHAVDEIGRLTWRANVEGHLAYAEAEAVSEALQARRTAFAAGRQLRLARPVLGLPRPAKRHPRSLDRQASIERRRRQAMSGVVPIVTRLEIFRIPAHVLIATDLNPSHARRGPLRPEVPNRSRICG